MTITNNWYGAYALDGNYISGSGDRCGIEDIQFAGTIITPEPTMAVLLFTGLLGLLAYAWRKRK